MAKESPKPEATEEESVDAPSITLEQPAPTPAKPASEEGIFGAFPINH